MWLTEVCNCLLLNHLLPLPLYNAEVRPSHTCTAGPSGSGQYDTEDKRTFSLWNITWIKVITNMCLWNTDAPSSLSWWFWKFNNLSVILQLGSRRYPISEIQVARLGFEPKIPCFESQELLNHSDTATPMPPEATKSKVALTLDHWPAKQKGSFAYTCVSL